MENPDLFNCANAAIIFIFTMTLCLLDTVQCLGHLMFDTMAGSKSDDAMLV